MHAAFMHRCALAIVLRMANDYERYRMRVHSAMGRRSARGFAVDAHYWNAFRFHAAPVRRNGFSKENVECHDAEKYLTESINSAIIHAPALFE